MMHCGILIVLYMPLLMALYKLLCILPLYPVGMILFCAAFLILLTFFNPLAYASGKNLFTNPHATESSLETVHPKNKDELVRILQNYFEQHTAASLTDF